MPLIKTFEVNQNQDSAAFSRFDLLAETIARFKLKRCAAGCLSSEVCEVNNLHKIMNDFKLVDILYVDV